MQKVDAVSISEVTDYFIYDSITYQFSSTAVLIDSNALYQIFSKINFCGLGKVSKSDFSENIKEWWRVAANLKKKVKKQDILVNAYGFNKEGNFYPLDVRDNDRVVGLNPGRKDLFVAMSEEKNQLDILTPSCSSITSYNNYLTYVLQHMHTLIEFYGERCWLRMR
ncbi:6112_t:CDS:2 [Gigaspora rosea]|nr:6112_t:CDS:2 [Gigaspora rosea]